jgi:hypothetical protein
MRGAGWLWISSNAIRWVAVGAAAVLLLESGDSSMDVQRNAAEARRVVDQLGLSDRQRGQLHQILDEYQEQVKREDTAFWDRVDQLGALADKSIENLLTPKQRDAYRALVLSGNP